MAQNTRILHNQDQSFALMLRLKYDDTNSDQKFSEN